MAGKLSELKEMGPMSPEEEEVSFEEEAPMPESQGSSLVDATDDELIAEMELRGFTVTPAEGGLEEPPMDFEEEAPLEEGF
jgi:hypothetical protein